MKLLVWLDDTRNPFEDDKWISLYVPEFIKDGEIVWIKSYDEFVNWIEYDGVPDMIAFDHDLGDEDAKTGYDAVKWLVDYCDENDAEFPEYTIQSDNPVGAKNMKTYIENAKRMLNI